MWPRRCDGAPFARVQVSTLLVLGLLQGALLSCGRKARVSPAGDNSVVRTVGNDTRQAVKTAEAAHVITTAARAAPRPVATADDREPPVATPPEPNPRAMFQQNLAYNGARAHLFAEGGLWIPFGSVGALKYMDDYQSPLRVVANGAVVKGGEARLMVPLPAGPMVVHVRFSGSPRDKVGVSLDGKRLPAPREARTESSADAGVATGQRWHEQVMAVPAVTAGEHRLRIAAAKSTILHDVWFQPTASAPAPQATGAAPPASEFAAVASVDPRCPNAEVTPTRTHLPAARESAMLVDVPLDGTLGFVLQGEGAGAVNVQREDASGKLGAATELWRGNASANRVRVSLAAFAGQLVRLQFTTTSCATLWHEPVVEGAVAEVRADTTPGTPGTPSTPGTNDATPGTPGTPGTNDATPGSAPPVNARHALLVVVDTLRADRLRAYGETRIATPAISAFAERGLVALRNQAMAPSSPPSHATIHTGQIPRVHGIAGDKGHIPPTVPVLSALLRDAGFYTGYVGNNDFAMAKFKDVAKWHEYHTPTREKAGMDCTAVVARALQMVDTALAHQQRFFISTLPVEPHVPYRFHAGITERFFAGPWAPPFGKEVTGEHLEKIKSLSLGASSFDQLRALHDGEVEYFDGCFQTLLDGLRTRGVLDETAIVLTSDHGEGLGERGGRVGHAYSLNHELVAVPLIVAGPGVPAVRVTSPTSNADIAPTVLALLGLPADSRMATPGLGAALAARGQGPRMVASEYGRAFALSAGRWHYVVGYDGEGALYDRDTDRQEQHAVQAQHPLWHRYFRDVRGFYLAYRSAWRGSWGTLSNWSATAPIIDDTTH